MNELARHKFNQTSKREGSMESKVNLYEVFFKSKQSADAFLRSPDIQVLRYDINPDTKAVMATYRIIGKGA